jgi:hypothetical protein
LLTPGTHYFVGGLDQSASENPQAMNNVEEAATKPARECLVLPNPHKPAEEYQSESGVSSCHTQVTEIKHFLLIL